MGNSKFKNLESGSPSSSNSCLQMNNEFALTSRQNYASEGTSVFHDGSNAKVDPLSFTYTPFSVSPFPSKNMHMTFPPHTQKIPQNYGNLMVDLNQQQLHNLQNPLIGPNSIIGGNVPSLYGQDFQCPERNVKGISCTGDNCEIASKVMNDSTCFNSFQVHETNRYFTPVRGNGGGGYEMIWHDGEVDIGNIHGLHINNLVGAKDSVGMLYEAPTSGGISNSNNDMVSPASHFCCPNISDGSFLSLGIGGSMDARSNLYPSNRKIIGELDGPAASQLNTCHVQQAAGTSLNAGPNLVGGFSSLQSNFHGFTSQGPHVGGGTLSNNNVGVRPGSSSHLNSIQFHILQEPQAYERHGLPTSCTRNLDITSDANAGYRSVDPCEGLVGNLGATSGPSNSSLSGWLDCQQTASSGLESESILLSCTAAQPTFHQINKHFTETVQKFPRESSMVASQIRFKGNPNKQDCSGPLLPASKSQAGQDVAENAQTPMRQHFQPAGTPSYANGITAPGSAESSQLSKNILEQVFKGNAAQATGDCIFPPRLGIQVNDHISAQAAGDALFPKNADIKVTDPRAAYAAECGVYPKEIGFQMRHPQEAFPVRFPKALLDPTCSTGQGKSPAKGCGLSQASGAFCGRSLKRSTAQPPPADPMVQRRRITHRRNHQSGLIQPQSYPAIPFSIPAAFPHIKWQDSDGLSQPTGEKCMLCKRDLSFTPEGPVYQPPVPPTVAVLPCGHTFHDHCLQIIVPEDQSKNPPCIPCAISET